MACIYLFFGEGEWVINSAGANFTPHVVHVNTEENVAGKIFAFSQKSPRAICILSANGVISNVTIRHPCTSGGMSTYEGLSKYYLYVGLSRSLLRVLDYVLELVG